MSVKAVLDKLTAHNQSVIGCIVTTENGSEHNLAEPYNVVDAQAIGERAQHMLDLMLSLKDTTGEVEHVFIEMEAHSVYARRVGEASLVLVNKPMGRDAFRKAQVGVNLFIKPLEKAMNAFGVKSDEELPVVQAPPKKTGRIYRGQRY